MPFITLTDTNDTPVWVRTETISTIGRHRDRTLVNSCAVRELPEQILELIADAERGGVAVTDEMVDAARDEMARQTLLLDDEPLPDDLWADTPYEDKFKFTTVARMALTAALKARRP